MLSIQVNNLEEKINSLMTKKIESEYKDYDSSGNYAYASEKDDGSGLYGPISGTEDDITNGSTHQTSEVHNADLNKNYGSDKNEPDGSNIDKNKSDKSNPDNSGTKQSDSENTKNPDNLADKTANSNTSDAAKNTGKNTAGEGGTESQNQKVSKEAGKKEQKADKSEKITEKNKEEKSSDVKAESETSKDTQGIYHEKKVYLTFDDGPSKNTDKILDILADYNVKATFFVIGSTDEENLKRYKRIVDEGHTLGMHSYSHNYKEIYNSLEDFDKDFTKLWKLLYDTTGYMPSLYRFPGGSLNQVSKQDIREFIRYLNKKGITYYDWNVVNGDAEGKDYTEEQMIENVLTGVAKKEVSIVLMHDGTGKDKTVATLPKILDALISGGAQVLPLDENVPLIQQVKASSVK